MALMALMTFVPGLIVRILTREGARAGRRTLLDAVIDLTRREGLAGVTVTRALEGYSPHGGMRSANWADVGDDLPLTIEIVDRRERIEQALPHLTALVAEGAL
ncbi:MAG: DUF190 domain-containing protein, partial [Ktedonobacterales bacterium]